MVYRLGLTDRSNSLFKDVSELAGFPVRAMAMEMCNSEGTAVGPNDLSAMAIAR